MLPCHSVTAAGPLLGPSLWRIRCTPLARLAIGYRLLVPRVQATLSIDPAREHCCRRALGHGLLLDRILTGGNQNEGLPLANWQIVVERAHPEIVGEVGQLFDAIA
jgi:hypothetical protein